MVSALAREVDWGKHHSVYRGERDRVDALLAPAGGAVRPTSSLLFFFLSSTTSSLELLINYV